jgi:hypothetical protein
LLLQPEKRGLPAPLSLNPMAISRNAVPDIADGNSDRIAAVNPH